MVESVVNYKRYDPVRRRIYGGVLVFSVAAGILLTAVPAVRARLFDRINILKTAMTDEPQLEIMSMGENDIPYPREFVRPGSVALVSRPTAEPPVRRLTAVQSGATVITPPVLIGAADSVNLAEDDEDDDSPRFQQGELEREAYEKTLAANEKLAAMARDGEQESGFKTWGAARRDGDVYWVRVIFQNASGADVEYIWQTDIASGRVTPLNFNARSF